MTRRSILHLLLCVALGPAPAAASSAPESVDFLIIVHPDNPTDTLDRRQLSRIFFKLKSRWSDGHKIRPVDQGSQSPIRDSFSRTVHQRSINSVRNYWQRRLFSGQSTPPPELGSDQQVLDVVRREPGAIGYVSAAAGSIDGVKVLGIVDLPGYDEFQTGPEATVETEWQSARVVLSGSCGFEGLGLQAVLESRHQDRALRVTVETSVRGDRGQLRASSVEDHVLGRGERKPLGCTQPDSHAEERRYAIVGVSPTG